MVDPRSVVLPVGQVATGVRVDADRVVAQSLDDRRARVAARGIHLVLEQRIAEGDVGPGMGLLHLIPHWRGR